MSPQEDDGLKPEVEDLDVIFDEVTPNEEVIEQVGKELTDAEVAQMMPKNIPYTKIINSEGDIANPITKGKPYNNPFLNRRDKKAMLKKATKHPKNNKKGIRLIVTKFAKNKFIKTEVVKQRVEKGYSKPQLQEDGTIVNENLTHKARTLVHNKTQL